MEVAPRYALLTLFTLFTLITLFTLFILLTLLTLFTLFKLLYKTKHFITRARHFLLFVTSPRLRVKDG